MTQNTAQTLEEVLAIIEKELSINDEKLDGEALRQVRIFSTIQRLHMQHTRILEVKLREQLQLKMKLVRYYSGKATAEEYKARPLREAILKSDVDAYVKVDPLTLEMSSLVEEQERIVKAIEEAKQQLNDRTRLLRIALDFRRMNQGQA